MASARGAIRSCAKPFTVLRNISTSAPRPKSKPAQALGIMRGLRSHAKLYNLDITLSAPRLPFYLACARKLVGASAGAGLANGKPCIPLLPATGGANAAKKFLSFLGLPSGSVADTEVGASGLPIRTPSVISRTRWDGAPPLPANAERTMSTTVRSRTCNGDIEKLCLSSQFVQPPE